MLKAVFPKKCPSPQCGYEFDAQLDVRCSKQVFLLNKLVGECGALLCPKCGSHVDPPNCV